MARISLAGWKDPVRRPRYIIWTGVALLFMAAFVIVALGVTSTRWFCSEGCHKVQDDTIIAYNKSTHAEISCMACHMPVSANPVIFLMHKAEALGELYMTVTNNFELPLNAESEVSLTMKSGQCLQCHNMENRTVTPSKGIIIDHEAHAKVDAACPVCHNRIGHREDFKLTLNDPKTGKPNRRHANFMTMQACFRCHGLEKGAPAPGTCSACHPATFDLTPPSHKAGNFYPKGHAELAKEKYAEAQKARTELKVDVVSGERKAEIVAGGRQAAGTEGEESIGEELLPVETIFYCNTCHTDQFCINCHGMPMPHPEEFKKPKNASDPAGHPAVSKAKPAKCVMCHTKANPNFCNECHHGEEVKWEYQAKVPWTKQHATAVGTTGVKACLEQCHKATFCVACHTKTKAFPTSHRQKTWTYPVKPTVTVYGQKPAEPSAKHSLAAQQSSESCAVCHGEGGPNAAFCKRCHRSTMPHADEFKKNHVSAKSNPRPCQNCHRWKEICSNCHHIGSSFTKPWTQVHGRSVNKNGAANCLNPCHGGDSGTDKTFCVNCHTKRQVKPASHNGKKFVRDYSGKMAGHVQLYDANGEACTYCHKGTVEALPNSKFCTSCHRLTMPHPDGFGPPEGAKPTADNGGQHAAGFKDKKLSRKTCANCHQAAFCNSCHHQGSSATRPWVRYHPVVVKKNGATACFDCHEETFCSNCHVRRAAQILGK